MTIKGHNCTTCKYPGDIHKSPCHECLYGSNWERKPITNADRIRAMTDEELAEWMNHLLNHLFPTLAYEWLLDWLKQEAGE